MALPTFAIPSTLLNTSTTMRRLTIEEFIERAKEIHGDKYDYSNVNYINSNTKVCIICKRCNKAFWQTPSHHLCGEGCATCGFNSMVQKRRSSKEKFVDKARIIHGNKYDYSKVEYVNSHTKVCINCPEHGEFWQTPSNHLNGCGCHMCMNEKFSKSRTFSKDVFIEKARIKHGERYDYSKVEYISCFKKVEIICPIHGVFWQAPSRHLRGNGCPLCGNKKTGEKLRKGKEQFIHQANIMHNYKYDYSQVDYINSDTNVCIICPEHGAFFQAPKHHLSGHGCSKCVTSKGEFKVEEYLKQNKIEYESQYPIKLEKQLFSRSNLRVDFYLPNSNAIIEFNGKQHYKRMDFFHSSDDDFAIQVDRDKRLRQYCKKHKINLIEIKYDQIDNIDKILNKKLKIKNK